MRVLGRSICPAELPDRPLKPWNYWRVWGGGRGVLQARVRADESSAVTAAEVARTLRRLEAARAIDARARESAWARYTGAVAHWQVYAVSEAVLARASQAFPIEPVRTLDAVHLATATLFSLEVAPVTMLSSDRKIRENAHALGLDVSSSAI